ncbi:hypothetical protein [Nonomuraea sp. NPDC049695]|uniref:hypothetical protein n=1 Tax=Nonomuraea sp. NPDC049695 TaxID=3154734 RepID=UPI00342FB644
MPFTVLGDRLAIPGAVSVQQYASAIGKASMADDPPTPAMELQFIEGAPDGYCDAVTGVCTVPGAATPEFATGSEIRDGGAWGC